MLAFEDWLLVSIELILVELLIRLDERHEINRALANENNVAIFDVFCVIFSLHNATLPHIHRLERVVSANRNVPLTCRLERNYRVVIKILREFNMISIAPVWQIGRLVKRLAPLLSVHGALAVEARV